MARTGRPSSLTEELIDKAYAYLEETSNLSTTALLPTIEGLALHLHISRDTLYEWEKENNDFSDILEELRQAQANKIMQNSMLNRYNSTISKLMLSKHGYIDKSEQDVTSKGEALNQPVTADVLETFISKVKNDTKQK